MKVLLLCATPEYTGPAELMLEDARALLEAGHEVRVAFDTRREGSLRGRVEALGLPIEEGLDLSRKFRPEAAIADVLHLRRALREGRYDTLHCRFAHDHHLALLAAAGRRRGLRILRSTELLQNVAPGAQRNLPYTFTDFFAVPSDAHRRDLVRFHGVPEERVRFLPGRVDAQRFSPGPSELRAELGIPEDAPVAGIVSRIKPDRRHAELLAAFARVHRDLPDAWLVLVGRGEGVPEVEAAIANLGIGHRVRLAGYRVGPSLEDAYRALDVKAWIAPGNDGTCRAVLEAMASGCAVLGGRFGAVAEAVVDRITGRLCDPDDPDDLASKLRWLLEDRRRARDLGAAGRERARQVYSPGLRKEAVLRLYESAWAESPRVFPLG